MEEKIRQPVRNRTEGVGRPEVTRIPRLQLLVTPPYCASYIGFIWSISLFWLGRWITRFPTQAAVSNML